MSSRSPNSRWTVPDVDLFDQLQAFRERHEHFAIVIDEYGSIMGVVTLEDIMEEIVEEIADEHDDAMASGIARRLTAAMSSRAPSPFGT